MYHCAELTAHPILNVSGRPDGAAAEGPVRRPSVPEYSLGDPLATTPLTSPTAVLSVIAVPPLPTAARGLVSPEWSLVARVETWRRPDFTLVDSDAEDGQDARVASGILSAVLPLPLPIGCVRPVVEHVAVINGLRRSPDTGLQHSYVFLSVANGVDPSDRADDSGVIPCNSVPTRLLFVLCANLTPGGSDPLTLSLEIQQPLPLWPASLIGWRDFGAYPPLVDFPAVPVLYTSSPPSGPDAPSITLCFATTGSMVEMVRMQIATAVRSAEQGGLKGSSLGSPPEKGGLGAFASVVMCYTCSFQTGREGRCRMVVYPAISLLGELQTEGQATGPHRVLAPLISKRIRVVAVPRTTVGTDVALPSSRQLLLLGCLEGLPGVLITLVRTSAPMVPGSPSRLVCFPISSSALRPLPRNSGYPSQIALVSMSSSATRAGAVEANVAVATELGRIVVYAMLVIPHPEQSSELTLVRIAAVATCLLPLHLVSAVKALGAAAVQWRSAAGELPALTTYALLAVTVRGSAVVLTFQGGISDDAPTLRVAGILPRKLRRRVADFSQLWVSTPERGAGALVLYLTPSTESLGDGGATPQRRLSDPASSGPSSLWGSRCHGSQRLDSRPSLCALLAPTAFVIGPVLLARPRCGAAHVRFSLPQLVVEAAPPSLPIPHSILPALRYLVSATAPALVNAIDQLGFPPVALEALEEELSHTGRARLTMSAAPGALLFDVEVAGGKTFHAALRRMHAHYQHATQITASAGSSPDTEVLVQCQQTIYTQYQASQGHRLRERETLIEAGGADVSALLTLDLTVGATFIGLTQTGAAGDPYAALRYSPLGTGGLMGLLISPDSATTFAEWPNTLSSSPLMMLPGTPLLPSAPLLRSLCEHDELQDPIPARCPVTRLLQSPNDKGNGATTRQDNARDGDNLEDKQACLNGTGDIAPRGYAEDQIAPFGMIGGTFEGYGPGASGLLVGGDTIDMLLCGAEEHTSSSPNNDLADGVTSLTASDSPIRQAVEEDPYFEIVRPLGAGTFGSVVLAQHRIIPDCFVALKRIEKLDVKKPCGRASTGGVSSPLMEAAADTDEYNQGSTDDMPSSEHGGRTDHDVALLRTFYQEAITVLTLLPPHRNVPRYQGLYDTARHHVLVLEVGAGGSLDAALFPAYNFHRRVRRAHHRDAAAPPGSPGGPSNRLRNAALFANAANGSQRDTADSPALSNAYLQYRRQQHTDALLHIQEPLLIGWLSQMLQGLRHLHLNGIIHRDVKAANALLAQPLRLDRPGGCDDSEQRVLWADFGVSAVDGAAPAALPLSPQTVPATQRHTAMRTVIGTMGCTAPELLEHWGTSSTATYNNRCDLWGVGVMLYCYITGRGWGSAGGCVGVATAPGEIIEVCSGQLPPLLYLKRLAQQYGISDSESDDEEPLMQPPCDLDDEASELEEGVVANEVVRMARYPRNLGRTCRYSPAQQRRRLLQCSDALLALIDRLMCIDMRSRPSADEALRSSLFIPLAAPPPSALFDINSAIATSSASATTWQSGLGASQPATAASTVDGSPVGSLWAFDKQTEDYSVQLPSSALRNDPADASATAASHCHSRPDILRMPIVHQQCHTHYIHSEHYFTDNPSLTSELLGPRPKMHRLLPAIIRSTLQRRESGAWLAASLPATSSTPRPDPVQLHLLLTVELAAPSLPAVRVALTRWTQTLFQMAAVVARVEQQQSYCHSSPQGDIMVGVAPRLLLPSHCVHLQGGGSSITLTSQPASAISSTDLSLLEVLPGVPLHEWCAGSTAFHAEASDSDELLVDEAAANLSPMSQPRSAARSSGFLDSDLSEAVAGGAKAMPSPLAALKHWMNYHGSVAALAIEDAPSNPRDEPEEEGSSTTQYSSRINTSSDANNTGHMNSCATPTPTSTAATTLSSVISPTEPISKRFGPLFGAAAAQLERRRRRLQTAAFARIALVCCIERTSYHLARAVARLNHLPDPYPSPTSSNSETRGPGDGHSEASGLLLYLTCYAAISEAFPAWRSLVWNKLRGRNDSNQSHTTNSSNTNNCISNNKSNNHSDSFGSRPSLSAISLAERRAAPVRAEDGTLVLLALLTRFEAAVMSSLRLLITLHRASAARVYDDDEERNKNYHQHHNHHHKRWLHLHGNLRASNIFMIMPPPAIIRSIVGDDSEEVDIINNNNNTNNSNNNNNNNHISVANDHPKNDLLRPLPLPVVLEIVAKSIILGPPLPHPDYPLADGNDTMNKGSSAGDVDADAAALSRLAEQLSFISAAHSQQGAEAVNSNSNNSNNKKRNYESPSPFKKRDTSASRANIKATARQLFATSALATPHSQSSALAGIRMDSSSRRSLPNNSNNYNSSESFTSPKNGSHRRHQSYDDKDNSSMASGATSARRSHSTNKNSPSPLSPFSKSQKCFNKDNNKNNKKYNDNNNSLCYSYHEADADLG